DPGTGTDPVGGTDPVDPGTGTDPGDTTAPPPSATPTPVGGAGSQLNLATPAGGAGSQPDSENGTTTDPVTSTPNYDPVLGSGTDPPASEPVDESASLVTGVARALAAYSEQASKLAERIDSLAERVGDVLGDLARALDRLLGDDGAPNPADGGIVQLLAVFSEQVDGLVQGVGDVLGALLGGGAAPTPGGSPIVPPDAPIAIFPVSPGGASPDGSFSGAAAGSGNAFVPLFGTSALLSLALMRGGKPWWLRGETLKPKSALRLAIERPG
ncbi:MAG TPA: hypothetical protein VKA51_14400, partial [Rubrobacteraceae bacterium]|nr:hypothetical protein [Rubrobacteraceae bacterium]